MDRLPAAGASEGRRTTAPPHPVPLPRLPAVTSGGRCRALRRVTRRLTALQTAKKHSEPFPQMEKGHKPHDESRLVVHEPHRGVVPAAREEQPDAGGHRHRKEQREQQGQPAFAVDTLRQGADVSSDIRGIFFIVSQRFIEEAFPKIGEILPIFLYIQKYPKIELTANQCFNIQQFYDFFIQRLKDQSVYRDKMISSILQALIYYISGLLINSDKREKKERKEELLSKFIQLIIKHYKENRTLDFYAEKLFISTKYMSDIIKKTSGLTAHDWIDRYTILEAKILLRSTNKTIQEISNELNFPNHSFFSKYFKHHMGMTPKAYRQS